MNIIKNKEIIKILFYNILFLPDFLCPRHRNCCELLENLDGHVEVILSGYVSANIGANSNILFHYEF